MSSELTGHQNYLTAETFFYLGLFAKGTEKNGLLHTSYFIMFSVLSSSAVMVLEATISVTKTAKLWRIFSTFMKRPNANLRNIELTQRFIKRQVVVEIVRVLVTMVVVIKVVMGKKKLTSGESEIYKKKKERKKREKKWC